MRTWTVNDTLYMCLESERTPLRQFMIIIDVYLASVLILFGTVGNMMSVAVLRKDVSMRSTTRLILQVLALTDLTYLFCSVFYQPLFAIAFDPEWGNNFIAVYLPIEPYVSPMISIASMSGTWIIVLLSTDRYLTIYYPMQAKKLFTSTRLKLYMTLIWIISIAFNAVRFTGKEIRYHLDPDSGAVVLIISLRDDLQYDPHYILVYQVILVFLVRIILPMVCLLYINSVLVIVIRRNIPHKGSFHSPQLSRHHAHVTSKRSTLMLVIVVFVFIVSMVPSVYGRILWLTRIVRDDPPGQDGQRQIYDDHLLYTYSITKLFLTFNSSVNFLIYVAIEKRFRVVLLGIIRSHFVCSSVSDGDS